MSVRPVRRREYSDALGVDVVRVVAYRPVCSCGWRGKAKRNVREARVQLGAHHAT